MTSSQRLPQRSLPLYEQTYLSMRSAILSGEIAADERLVETQLAQRFQVSRTPVREAMRRLQHESLLASDDGGLYVVKLSLHDAIKLYDCRIALEQLAVRSACANASAEQLEAIAQTLIEAEQLAARQNSSQHRLLDLNFRFHRLIVQSSDNPWLVPILDQLSNHTKLLRIQTLQDQPDIIDIHCEHRQIYEAIARRDAQAAEKAIVDHLSASQQRIIEIFEPRVVPPPETPPPSVKCPRCESCQVSRNGRRLGKQSYLCRQCKRQFLESSESRQYSSAIREKCVALHASGIGFREIERTTGVNHNTVIRWVKAAEIDRRSPDDI